mmetsp:Transcript_2541/g.7601  ORF Transcript_2541/g.7601 Transcript_2541/m.7601 type:complete len:230 (-) Transcript_2541:1031-1720(-)
MLRARFASRKRKSVLCLAFSSELPVSVTVGDAATPKKRTSSPESGFQEPLETHSHMEPLMALLGTLFQWKRLVGRLSVRLMGESSPFWPMADEFSCCLDSFPEAALCSACERLARSISVTPLRNSTSSLFLWSAASTARCTTSLARSRHSFTSASRLESRLSRRVSSMAAVRAIPGSTLSWFRLVRRALRSSRSRPCSSAPTDTGCSLRLFPRTISNSSLWLPWPLRLP